MIIVGDRVVFHFIPSHVCGGNECRCAETETIKRDATVIEVHPADDLPQALALDVEFTADELATGLAKQQGHSRFFQGRGIPESGTWTELL